jgi:hypothetical protein
MTFEETLDSANSRIKADLENLYNLSMKIKMTHLDIDKIELLREMEERMYRTYAYVLETWHKYK